MDKVKITKEEVLQTLKKRWWIILIELAIVGVILLIDLLSKKYLLEFLQGQPGLHYILIDGFIDLRYSENTGAGFGMFKGNTTALIVVTFIVIVGLIVYLAIAQKESMWLRVSLLFIVGGGIGNLVDRLALGYVRDFFEFTFIDFAIFNLADSFVTIGGIMLVIVLIVMLVQEANKSKKAFEAEQQNKDADDVEELVHPIDQSPAVNEFLSGSADFSVDDTVIKNEPIDTQSNDFSIEEIEDKNNESDSDSGNISDL